MTPLAQSISIPYARVVTPTVTYGKYSLGLDVVNHVVTVNVPRGAMVARLTDATVEELGGGQFRIDGTNETGMRVVWSADNIGCGCRSRTMITDTAPENVPT